ncbi:selenocysteine-specific translation elongation factor [bacterium]|nr:selenocysteine-specific translation elongation factor [bacterium]
MSENKTHRHIVVGTAGHIDHGKTALVKALTGMETDRLEEEKRRGITIDLGFAFYGEKAAFVDVPGHERLIKNMVAGASAVRAALLVVAADDGVMPQTREHLAILNAIGIKHGLVAVTKCDLVDEEWADLVVEEVAELLESTSLRGSKICVVDSISGKGINELKTSLDTLLDEIDDPPDPGFFRMPIDRSFLIKGYGRVVTGTVASGELKTGSRVICLPGGQSYRIRGLQAHEKPVEQVHHGFRAALNLQGEGEPERGQVLLTQGRGISSDFIDVKLTLLPDARTIRHRTRIRLHLGTSEIIGRVSLVGQDEVLGGQTAFARLILENPVAVMQGDLGIIRLYSPLETLGGVKVLDPQPPDRNRNTKGLKERFTLLDSELGSQLEAIVGSRQIISFEALLHILPVSVDVLKTELENLVKSKSIHEISGSQRYYVLDSIWMEWRNKSIQYLQHYHKEQPDEMGCPKLVWGEHLLGRKSEDIILNAILDEMIAAGLLKFDSGLVFLPSHTVQLRKSDLPIAEKIISELKNSGFNTPLPSSLADEAGESEDQVRRIIRTLKKLGQVIILGERVILLPEVYEESKSKIVNSYNSGDKISPADVATMLNSSRKYIIPFLEHLDSEGITQRTLDGERQMV